MMEGNTDPEWLKRLEHEWYDPLREKIADLKNEVDEK